MTKEYLRNPAAAVYVAAVTARNKVVHRPVIADPSATVRSLECKAHSTGNETAVDRRTGNTNRQPRHTALSTHATVGSTCSDPAKHSWRAASPEA